MPSHPRLRLVGDRSVLRWHGFTDCKRRTGTCSKAILLHRYIGRPLGFLGRRLHSCTPEHT
eukprot:957564-Prymnesium_polylepis.1